METTERNGGAAHPELSEPTLVPVATTDMERRLDRIEQTVEHSATETRRIQRGFALFAALAFAIALVNLVAIAFKLGTKDVRVKALTAPAAAPATKAAPAALGHTVDVALREFSVAPQPAKAAAGKVSFRVHNAGQVKHEFVVIRTKRPAGSLLKGAEADETGNVGEVGDLRPGQSKKLTLKLTSGHYALICNLPGHYRAGQHADFTVK